MRQAFRNPRLMEYNTLSAFREKYYKSIIENITSTFVIKSMTNDVFEQNVLPFCQIVNSEQLNANIGFLCVYVPVSQIFNFNFFDQ